jgi:hypothetical protein
MLLQHLRPVDLQTDAQRHTKGRDQHTQGISHGYARHVFRQLLCLVGVEASSITVAVWLQILLQSLLQVPELLSRGLSWAAGAAAAPAAAAFAAA